MAHHPCGASTASTVAQLRVQLKRDRSGDRELSCRPQRTPYPFKPDNNVTDTSALGLSSPRKPPQPAVTENWCVGLLVVGEVRSAVV